uniref:Uncharacterized LOC103390504 n=1 Tax=Cynoglossus semilaevis TaxID=244447 RepID=A0A3P8UI61_CYNSE
MFFSLCHLLVFCRSYLGKETSSGRFCVLSLSPSVTVGTSHMHAFLQICHHEACFQGRVHFAHSNPQDGDASLIMNNVTFSDSGIYQCNVEQSFSMEHRQILLTVMENVSKPICTLYNDFEEGKNLKVMCRVFHGPIPWSFNWEKTSGNRLFPTNTKQKYGYLIIQQIKKSDSGTYRCTVSNPVSAECHKRLVFNKIKYPSTHPSIFGLSVTESWGQQSRRPPPKSHCTVPAPREPSCRW